jgi:hypothetical protein
MSEVAHKPAPNGAPSAETDTDTDRPRVRMAMSSRVRATPELRDVLWLRAVLIEARKRLRMTPHEKATFDRRADRVLTKLDPDPDEGDG